MSNGLNRDFSIWGAMKHPLVAVGIVGAFVGVTSLKDLDVEEMLDTYHLHLPHLGRNMGDYKLYLREHSALLSEKELRTLRSYNGDKPYTLELAQPDGVRTFEYTAADTFLLYIPEDAQGTSFTLYTGSAYGSGQKSASCIKDDLGFVCEPTHAFGTPCGISFFQGDDAFSAYPQDCGKLQTYAEGLRSFYTSLHVNH